jgi:hypothetical protein
VILSPAITAISAAVEIGPVPTRRRSIGLRWLVSTGTSVSNYRNGWSTDSAYTMCVLG